MASTNNAGSYTIPMHNPWDQQPNESSKAFERFALYRDIGAGRSLHKLSPKGLSKILNTGCRLERLNRDEPEQNLELVQPQNFDRLTLEECETLRNLHAKTEGKDQHPAWLHEEPHRLRILASLGVDI